MPRELAEHRLLTAEINRDRKARPQPFTMADIAPWTLTPDERRKIAETPVDAGFAASLRMQAMAARRAKRKECQEER